MNKKNCFMFLLLVFMILIDSCKNTTENKNSILYRNVSEPSKLILEMSLNNSIISDGNIYTEIEAKVIDKTDYTTILINDGSITVNNIKMRIIENSVAYKITDETVEVKPNTKYTFKITLSDRTNYSASINTQSKSPAFRSIPISLERGKDLVFKWDTSSIQDLLFLVFSYRDSIGVQITEYNLTLISSGEYSIPAKIFSWQTDSIKTLHLMLKSINKTDLNDFASLSSIRSEFKSEEKIVSLYP